MSVTQSIAKAFGENGELYCVLTEYEMLRAEFDIVTTGATTHETNHEWLSAGPLLDPHDELISKSRPSLHFQPFVWAGFDELEAGQPRRGFIFPTPIYLHNKLVVARIKPASTRGIYVVDHEAFLRHHRKLKFGTRSISQFDDANGQVERANTLVTLEYYAEELAGTSHAYHFPVPLIDPSSSALDYIERT